MLVTALAALSALAVGVSGCQSQRPDSPASEPAEGAPTETFIFAASADPAGLDPVFTNDGESARVARHIFEGLVQTKTGTADVEPGLATSWEIDEAGTAYTFALREGVEFSDGTPFNAEAVCFNFERWFHLEGLAASEGMSYYYNAIFGGFAGDDQALYESCAPAGEHEVTITLTRPYPAFISALAMRSFAMQSPTALTEYGADDIGGTEDAPEYSEYALAHPTGTGPFVFESWSPGEEVVLRANPNYWGERGQIAELVFRIISDPTARRQALEAGDIDGYDQVAPSDTAALEQAGFTVATRDPFNILHLGFKQDAEPMQDVRVRQALTYAIDREALVQQVLPEGSAAATQFMPPSVVGYSDNAPTYPYDPEKARALLAEAGYADGLTLNFTYPVNVSRPYMPNPEQIFSAIAGDLEAVGVTVVQHPYEWVEYIEQLGTAPNHLWLSGWTGDYNDPDNFLGSFFGRPTNRWGFTNQELFDSLAEARRLPDASQAHSVYAEISDDVMEFVPGVPLAHVPSSVGLSPRVEYYPASPTGAEMFNLIRLTP